MNVLAFTSALTGAIANVQVKANANYFPIKADQPDITFAVVFANETDFENFQKFVRNSQKDSLSASAYSAVGFTLYWPERGISNWTGFINEFQAGAQRANWAPHAKFTVALIDSMISRRTTMSSTGPGFNSVYQGTVEDSMLALPAVFGGGIGIGGLSGLGF